MSIRTCRLCIKMSLIKQNLAQGMVNLKFRLGVGIELTDLALRWVSAQTVKVEKNANATSHGFDSYGPHIQMYIFPILQVETNIDLC